MAATVALSVVGFVTVGRSGHLIRIASGVSGRWISSTESRSDWLMSPTAKNRSESLEGESSIAVKFPKIVLLHNK
jgi:hypothetical protein